MNISPAERFLRHTKPDESGCVLWTAAVDPTGYGRFWLRKRLALAHRAAYELFVGPIPDGLQVDHICRNRACVNPDHLRTVTASANVSRRRTAPAGVATDNHGTITGYATYRCRCDACRAANRAYKLAYYHRSADLASRAPVSSGSAAEASR